MSQDPFDGYDDAPDARPPHDAPAAPAAAAAGRRFAEAGSDLEPGLPLDAVPRGRGGRAGDGPTLALACRQPQNDTGNAARLILRHGDDFRYVRGLGWLAWDGRRWDSEGGEHAAQLAMQAVAAEIGDETRLLYTFDGEPPADYEKRLNSRRGFGRDSGNSGRISAAKREAEPHLAVDVDALDAAPRLLAVENGTLDFQRAPAGADGIGGSIEVEEMVRFRPGHDRAHLMTHASPVAFDAGSECPRWETFLETVQPDPDVRAFLARLVGYCLTGLNSEECLVAFEGKGANGKSLFIDVIEMLLGSAAAGIDFATLLADERRGGSGPTPDLARLRGVRLATAGEPERGAKLAEGRVKSITGGDKIVARHLNQEPVEFRATFKLIVSWNTRPRVGGDDGIWRRILLLIWPVQILPRAASGAPNPIWRRKEDMLAEFRAELPGILNWALRGYADWACGGLRPPAAVLAAVKSYRDQSDPVGAFLTECCETEDPSLQSPASELYACFVDWCHVQGWEGQIKQRTFGDALEERGHPKHKASLIYRKGVQILPDWRIDGAKRIAARRSDDRDPPASAYAD